MSGFSSMLDWKNTFQLCPIYLTGSSSLTNGVTSGVVPIISLIDPVSAGISTSLDDYLLNFHPLPGATTIDNAVATYPFANQAIAANALIAQPLQVSMQVVCPVRVPFDYWTKQSIMLSLQSSLKQHNENGGTYTVATPNYFYTNCIMVKMHDVSSGGSQQSQHTWQMDFLRPLLTLEEANNAQSSLYKKLTAGTQVTSSDTSGTSINTGTTSPLLVPSSSTGGGGGGSSVVSGESISSLVPNA